MNFRYYLAILLLSFTSTFVNGQAIQISQFSFSSSVWNGSTKTLTVKRTGQSTYLTFVALSRINLPEWTRAGLAFNIEVEAFAKKKNSTQLVKISDEIKFVTSDFIGTTSTTEAQYPTLTIPAGLIDEDDGNIVIKWRFYKQNYPSPYNQDGWTEWYTSTAVINLKLEELVLPPSTITGPDQFCDNGTYTITNPGTISLENATGIATLTDLGNNQWKVTRTRSSSGEVKIVSTVGTQKYTKSIIVGTKPPQITGGSSTVWSGNTYYYSVAKSDPSSTLNITAVSGPGLPYTIKVVGSQIELTTLSIGANVHDYIIRLRASETNSCGTSSTTTYSVRFRGGVGPIQ